jgi:signal transduction histidine kinase
MMLMTFACLGHGREGVTGARACAGIAGCVSAIHITISGSLLFPGDAMLPISVFFSSASKDKATRRFALAMAALPPLALMIRVVWAHDPMLRQMAVSAIAAVIQYAAWAVGYWKHLKECRLASASRSARLAYRDNEEHARLADMEERMRINREMHDILAHTLTAIAVQAESGKETTNDVRSKTVFGSIGQSAREAISDVRGLLNAVDGHPLHPEPVISDIPQLIDRYRNAGMTVAFAYEREEEPVPPGLGLSVYRVVEECLTNAMRHGCGHRALVALAAGDDAVRLTVENPIEDREDAAEGKGTGERKGTEVRISAGRGLTGIQQRCAQYDGMASFRASDGTFTVAAVWRIAHVAADDAVAATAMPAALTAALSTVQKSRLAQ